MAQTKAVTSSSKKRSAKTSEQAVRRFKRLPPVDRSWLLATTAIFAGVMAAGMVMAPKGVMAADCDLTSSNYYTCSGTPSGTVELSPNGDFDADFNNGFHQTSGTIGVKVNAAGHDAPGNNGNFNGSGLNFEAGSSVDVTGTGISVLDSGTVDIHVRPGANSEDGPASIIGSDTGMYIGPSGSSEDSGVAKVHVFNDGHIEGTTGNGTYVTSQGGSQQAQIEFALDNHSTQSLIGGTYGLHEVDVVSSFVDNGNGVIGGVSNDGVFVDGVTNTDPTYVGPYGDDSAVLFYNQNHGIIAGGGNGIDIQNVVSGAVSANADTAIYNGSYFDNNEDYHQGGLIYGKDGNGITVSEDAGNVTIHNGGTLGDSIYVGAQSGIDPQVYGNLNAILAGFAQSEDVPTGIYGGEDGINLSYIGGHVLIDNSSIAPDTSEDIFQGGVIFGKNNGISLSHVEEGVDIDNNYGYISGFDTAITGQYLNGGVDIQNDNGVAVGAEGIALGVQSGSTEIDNNNGLIVGYNGDAINVQYNVAPPGSTTYVNNADGSKDLAGGGLILSEDSAIKVVGYSLQVDNGLSGLIIGQGGLNTATIDSSENGSEDGYTEIDNRGVMTTGGLNATFDLASEEGKSGDVGFFIDTFGGEDFQGIPFHLSQVTSDFLLGNEFSQNTPGIVLALKQAAVDFANYSWSAGTLPGLIDSPIDQFYLPQAAAGLLVKGRNSATSIYNYSDGVMIGRVDLDGTSRFSEEGFTANFIKNDGFWLTHNTDSFGANDSYGNEMHNSLDDRIDNYGVIQTALSSEDREFTSFIGVNYFNNGEYQAAGLVSMIDGGVGDLTQIDHEFYGEEGASFLGIDVNLGPGAVNEMGTQDWTSVDQANWRSDRLWIGDTVGNPAGDGYVSGSTGLIIHQVGTSVTDTRGDTIVVVHSDDIGSEGPATPAFYIASSSNGYLNAGPLGAVQSGMYAWYLTQEGNLPDPDWVLTSDFAPQVFQLPGVITAAQNIFHDTAGVVADHVYGEHFPVAGGGGGGADLPVGKRPMMAMAPAADYGSIWGKISGSSTDTSTSVDEVLGGVPTTIDTSFNQKTFSLLAGADFHPSDDLRVGVFAGYIQSNVSFSSYGASAAFSGGTVGAYVAYTQGGFYADAEGKADILDLTYTAPFGGSFSASGLSTTVGVTANTGYRMEMGNNVFIEPLATVSYAYTTIGGFSNGGTSVTYTNGQSLQAGAGVKVGTSFSIVAGTTTELALTGKVMNEFGPDNSVTVTDSVDSYSFSTNSAGAFGLLDVAATTYSDDKSMSGFVSVGGTFSSDTHSVNVKAGLRKAF